MRRAQHRAAPPAGGATIILALAIAWAVPNGAAAQTANLNGAWRLIPAASDELMPALMQHAREDGLRTRGGLPGGGQPGVAGRLPGGSDMRSGDLTQSAADVEALHRDIAALLELTEAFELRQDDSTVTLYPLDLTYGNQTFYHDGRKIRREQGLEGPTEVRTRWDDGRLRVEHKAKDLRATAWYGLAAGGQTLVVELLVSGRLLAKPLALKRAYRREGPAGTR